MSLRGGPVHRLTVNYYHCELTVAAFLLSQWALCNSERQKQRKGGREDNPGRKAYTMLNYMLTVFLNLINYYVFLYTLFPSLDSLWSVHVKFM